MASLAIGERSALNDRKLIALTVQTSKSVEKETCVHTACEGRRYGTTGGGATYGILTVAWQRRATRLVVCRLVAILCPCSCNKRDSVAGCTRIGYKLQRLENVAAPEIETNLVQPCARHAVTRVTWSVYVNASRSAWFRPSFEMKYLTSCITRRICSTYRDSNYRLEFVYPYVCHHDFNSRP